MSGSQHVTPDSKSRAPEGRNTAVSWSLSGRAQPDAPLMDVCVSPPRFTIGRRAENNLCLTNTTVSGYHAELVYRERGLLLADLGSTNGTFVNGQRVTDPVAIRHNDQLQFGTARFAVRQHQGGLAGVTVAANISHFALAYLQFEKLLGEPAVTPFYQPIVRLPGGECQGYEVLARSSLLGLETPAKMFRVANELGAGAELSRLMRTEGVRQGAALGNHLPLYLNTHPAEFGTPELFSSLESLRAEFPQARLILEIHEAAVTSTALLMTLRRKLQELEIGLAYDDFGAGQARLLELAEAPADIIKFDMQLIRGLHTASPERVQMIGSLVQLVRSLGAVALAEGVEFVEEAAICHDLGFALAQGFFFGYPAAAATWTAGSAASPTP